MKKLVQICITLLICFQSAMYCSTKKQNIAIFTNYSCESCTREQLTWDQRIKWISDKVGYYLEVIIFKGKHNFDALYEHQFIKDEKLLNYSEICNNNKNTQYVKKAIYTAKKKLNSRLLIVAQPVFDKSKKNFSIHFSIIDLDKNCTTYNVATKYITPSEIYKENNEVIKQIANELSTIIKTMI